MVAALVQIVGGESGLGDCLTAMGNSLMLIIASVAGGVTLIFFIAVVVIVAVGNLTVMLR